MDPAERYDPELYTAGISPARPLSQSGQANLLEPSMTSARVWAVFGLMWSLIWAWGLASIVGILAGVYSLVQYRAVGRRPVLPTVSIALGVLGVAAAVVLVVTT
jgi:hypothetical protein